MKEHHEEQNQMIIAVPVNLHSKNPQHVEEVSLSNGLTITTFNMPIIGEDFDKGLQTMHKYFNKMKKSFEYYSNYLASVITVTFLPNFLYPPMVESLKDLSRKTTLVFSNLPGPQFALKFNGHQSKKLYAYAQAAGETGTLIGCISHIGKLKVTIVTDERRIKQPRHFMELFDRNMKEAIQRDMKEIEKS